MLLQHVEHLWISLCGDGLLKASLRSHSWSLGKQTLCKGSWAVQRGWHCLMCVATGCTKRGPNIPDHLTLLRLFRLHSGEIVASSRGALPHGQVYLASLRHFEGPLHTIKCLIHTPAPWTHLPTPVSFTKINADF